MEKILKSLFVGICLILSVTGYGAEPESSKKVNQTLGVNGVQSTTSVDPTCNVGSSRSDLDINNVRARYMNQGDMFWDPGLSLARYEVPKRTDNATTSKHSVFAAAIWLAGLEQGTDNIVVMVQTYRGQLRNYWPGPIRNYNIDTAFTKNSICSAWDRHFKCNRQIVKKFRDDKEAGLINDCDVDIPAEIKFWPGKGNPFLKQDSKFQEDPAAVESINNNLANFFDADTNGIYNPCRGDYPLWAGTEKDEECKNTEVNINSGADQVLWWVCNDVGNKKNFENNTSLVPGIGMEIQYEAFAYASTDATNDMTFLRQKLYNKGNFTLENAYLSQWIDPDLGNPGDDYVGCDVRRGLGICYNGDDDDEGQSGYGINPPAVAVDFFRGPRPDNSKDEIDWDLDCNGPTSQFPDTNERIVMSGFVYYNIGSNPINGDPDKYTDFYNYMRNRWKNGSEISFGGAGLDPVSASKPKAKYMFPNVNDQSDPYGFACGNVGCNVTRSCGSAWNEKTAGNPPGDRRFLANNGPFTLKPGSVNECTIGIVWARANGGGATGSFSKLLSADDLAQERFNSCFKRNIGPNNPALDIVELDKKLIFSVIPDIIVAKPLMTTETYIEENKLVTGGTASDPQDIYYRFQGYKVYQLQDDKVSVQDLNNPDRARLLDGDVNGDSITDFNGLMDRQDGVTSISNFEFNADLDATVNTPKVKNTPDKGIFRSFQVERDMFSNISGGKISNFKKYYYAVVAYGYNKNKEATRPYIQGVENYKIYTAIPHKATPESFGTIPSGKFGGSFQVSRILGTGNSGNNLEMIEGEEEKILQGNILDKVTYKESNGPFDVKVYNPKGVKSGKFQIKLSSRLRYQNGSYAFKVGDVIETDNNYPVEAGYKISPRFKYIQGKAIVNRIVPVDGFPGQVDLDIDIIGCDGGDFSYQIDKTFKLQQSTDSIFLSSKQVGCTFSLAGDLSTATKAIEFNRYDFWKLTELGSNTVIPGTYPISALSEELIPDFGIAVRPKRGQNPGTNPLDSLQNNGVLTTDIVVDVDPLKRWILGAPNSLSGAFREDAAATGSFYATLDPFKAFKNFAQGAWAPYILGSRSNGDLSKPFEGGPQISGSISVDTKTGYLSNFSPNAPSVLQSLARSRNVDIVFTSDKSKWTRVPVLQYDSVGSSTNVLRYMLSKSRKNSVDRDLRADLTISPYGAGLPSRGMSWFPGYAIDLDRGARLNMMFSESMLADKERGNDLKWEPRANGIGKIGTKNYIYVLHSIYDEGKSTEYALDSIYANFASLSVPNFLPIIRGWHVQNIMYSGLMDRQFDGVLRREVELYASPVRVKLRVQRAFEAFAHGQNQDCNPVYEFETNSIGGRFIASTGQSGMDLIRVVPNPYLSISGYENSQIDSRVKLINLPSQCVISIYNLAGSLIRQFNFDQTSTKPYSANADGKNIVGDRGNNFQTFIDWDLKNQNGIPIASGVYIIHVNSQKFGDKVLKWFGVLRPIDLDSFN